MHESSDAVQSLKLVGYAFPFRNLVALNTIGSGQQFSGMLSASIVFDIIWVFNNEHSGFVKLLLLFLWLLKARCQTYDPHTQSR